jgi:YhgE/Pip-like protein
MQSLPFAFGSREDWTGALLATSVDHIDYLGEHFYGYPNLVIDAAKEQFVESDEPLALKVRRLSNRVQFKFEAWDEYVKRMPYLANKDIRFAFDEWSPRNRSVGSGPAPASNPMLNPLTNALVYHEFFRHSDKVGLAVATGGMGTLANDAYGEAIGFRMEGLVMKVLHLEVSNTAAFYLTCVLVAMVFTSIVEFLIVNLGDVGKFLSILFLVLQLTACGGTFPMETVPSFFNAIYRYMPMTYSVNLLKETISGFSSVNATHDVVVLIGIFVVFTGATLAFSLSRKSKARRDLPIEIQ